MKTPRELKAWINKQRKLRGKKNGVVKWLWDHPTAIIKATKNKRSKTINDHDTGC